MKRSTLYIFGALLLTLAGGCSVQKKCPAPELNLPAEIVAGRTDSLTIGDMAWWEVYTDTTLCRGAYLRGRHGDLLSDPLEKQVLEGCSMACG